MRNLFLKYREAISYVFFGVITTLVDFLVFELFNRILGTEFYLVSNAIAWAVAVLVAFVTNKLWVFESKSWEGTVLRRELPAFVGARVLSLLFAEVGLFVLVDVLHFGDWRMTLPFIVIGGHTICKVILQVVVLILNYIFSKLVIFKRKVKAD